MFLSLFKRTKAASQELTREQAATQFAKLIGGRPNYEVAVAIENYKRPKDPKATTDQWEDCVGRAYTEYARFLSRNELVHHRDQRLKIINDGPRKVMM